MLFLPHPPRRLGFAAHQEHDASTREIQQDQQEHQQKQDDGKVSMSDTIFLVLLSFFAAALPTLVT